jgi:hypothetical protein
MLMVAGRTAGGLAHPPTIEEMETELTEVIENFDRGVDVEALRLAKETGKRRLSQSGAGPFSVVLCRARPSTWAARTC